MSARLQRATTFARAGAPVVLGGLVTAAGWTCGVGVLLAVLFASVERYLSVRRR